MLCLTIVAAVPLEFSGSAFQCLSFSPLDYIVLAFLLATMIRFGFSGMIQSLKTAFGAEGLLLWTAFFIYALASARLLHGNIREALRWGEFLFVYWLGAETYRHAAPDAARRLGRVLLTTGGLMAVLVLAQFLKGRADYLVATGTFGQHNITGAFFSLSLPAAFALAYSASNKRPWLKAIPCLMLAAFLAAYSRGAWIGLTVSFIGYAFLRRSNRWRLTPSIAAAGLLAILFAFLAVMSPRRSIWNSGQRRLYWQAGVNVLRQHPWLGLGPGNYHAQILLLHDAVRTRALSRIDLIYHHADLFWQHLHNFYLQALVDYGALGASLLFLALGLLVYHALRRKRDEPSCFAPFKFQSSLSLFIICYPTSSPSIALIS